MCDLISDYKNQKEQYRKIFAQTGLEIQEFIEKNSPKNFEGEIFALYENRKTLARKNSQTPCKTTS